MSDPNNTNTTTPDSKKNVSFASDPLISPSTTITTPSSPIPPPTMKRRRSSLKQGLKMPMQPPTGYWKHSDPLLRRLRLRNGFGKQVELEKVFSETKVVLFLFGATWRGSMSEPYDVVEAFARRNPHRCTVIYVSVDSNTSAYESNTRGKSWLSMEWNDGSNLLTDPSPSTPIPLQPSQSDEPFLLAGDRDLEEEVHLSDPSGSLYLRPYSRVFLAEKLNVLGVPNVAVYHVGKKEWLTTHARIEVMKDGKAEGTWEKWENGERVEFGLNDFVHALRWTFAGAAVAISYLVAVRYGAVPDVVAQLSDRLTTSYLGGGGAGAGPR